MKFLFLCVANSARSQMAEGLARSLFPKTHQIMSAGSKPSFVHPLAIKVMQEIGIDITQQSSKSVHELPKEFTTDLSAVITLCEREVCPPAIKADQRLHWPLPDPADAETEAESLELFRVIRDEIKKRLIEWQDAYYTIYGQT